MKTTRYTITSKKVIALALALVLLATVFTGCNRTNEEETTTTTTTEVQTTIEVVTEIVTDENGETVTNDNGEAVTTEVTKVVEVTGQSEETTSSKTTTSTTKKNETTTKKNTSTGNTTTTTTKVAQATCTHKWGEWKTMGDYNDSSTWYEGRTCSKCGAVQKYSDVVNACNHSYGSWKYRSWQVRYKTCSKCGYEVVEEGDYKDACMGSKSEYLELLGYVNQARREAGLNELVYCSELQSGANTRAKELTVRYSHTRPDGSNYSTAYENYKFTTLHGKMFISCPENIVSGAKTAKQAFNAWMNSAGHKKVIMNENGFGFVASKCDTYWVMSVIVGPSE